MAEPLQQAVETLKEPFDKYYELGDKLGSGHFAVVCRCTKLATGSEFAVKKILLKRTAASRRGASLNDIYREVSILRLCQAHENIIHLFEVFESRQHVMLIMELVSGPELFEFLSERQKVCEDEAVVCLRQLLSALKHLHLHRVVHLDLKPENLMLKCRNLNHLKIIDFGLSRQIDIGSEERELVGTAEFMAPEVVNFDPLTMAADIWSVGVITYIMLSGMSPFLGESQQETLSNVTSGHYDLDNGHFQNTSEMAKDFMRRLLIKKPKKRATVDECLQHEWIKPKDLIQRRTRRSSTIDVENLRRFVELHKTKRFDGRLSDGQPSAPPAGANVLEAEVVKVGEETAFKGCYEDIVPNVMNTVSEEGIITNSQVKNSTQGPGESALTGCNVCGGYNCCEHNSSIGSIPEDENDVNIAQSECIINGTVNNSAQVMNECVLIECNVCGYYDCTEHDGAASSIRRDVAQNNVHNAKTKRIGLVLDEDSSQCALQECAKCGCYDCSEHESVFMSSQANNIIVGNALEEGAMNGDVNISVSDEDVNECVLIVCSSCGRYGCTEHGDIMFCT